MAILDFVRYHWNVLASNAPDMMDGGTIWDLFILRCSWRKILQFWSKDESNLTLFWFWAGFLMIGLGSVGGGHFLGIFRCLCSVVWRFQNYEIFCIEYGKYFHPPACLRLESPECRPWPCGRCWDRRWGWRGRAAAGLSGQYEWVV